MKSGGDDPLIDDLVQRFTLPREEAEKYIKELERKYSPRKYVYHAPEPRLHYCGHWSLETSTTCDKSAIGYAVVQDVGGDGRFYQVHLCKEHMAER